MILAALATLADLGPGRPSLDAAFLPRLHGRAWPLLSLGAGIGGSLMSERVLGELGGEARVAPQSANGEVVAPVASPA